jgi:16S rRNA (uracil1498-N3)-methyltransferase
MTRRRWIADEVHGDRATLVGDHAAHLARVLRARIGQQFDISANDKLRRGTVTEVAADRVVFELGEVVEAAALPAISLLLAIFKFDRMEWAIEKCTELGVAEIVPLISRRVESHLAASALKRVERWRRIAIVASEQSRRITPPEVHEPTKLRDALARYRQDASSQGVPTGGSSVCTTRIVLAESERELKLTSVLDSWVEGPIAIAVGPEGGWTDDELAAFAESSWTAVSLGPTILRAETAAIAASAIVMAAIT